jgi:F-type H+-transporting ATPase subunit a
MLPFNIISELSRTLALAVRLFGNMMSGAMIIGILLTITPFLFPIIMTALGLLTGMVQAYIFSILRPLRGSAPVWIKTPARSSSMDGESAPASSSRNSRRCPCRHKSPSCWR